MTRLRGALAMAAILASVIFFSPSVSAEGIELWWPVDGTEVQGVQPFKALVPGHNPETYQMFWQVDNGQWNIMTDDTKDSLHKEALVDTTPWMWNVNGFYTVRILATDLTGQPFLEKTITINVKHPDAPTASVLPLPLSTPIPHETPVPQILTEEIPTLTPEGVPQLLDVTPMTVSMLSRESRSIVATQSPAPQARLTATLLRPTLDMWWPRDGVTLSGKQPFKGMVKNAALSSYSMYWQVDGDRLNPMQDSSEDYPHKEARVDLSGWNWRGTGPYTLNFVAKDASGNMIAEKAITVSLNNTSGSQSGSYAPSINTEAQKSPLVSPVATPISLPIITPTPSQSGSSNDPFEGARLDINPYNEISSIAKDWKRTHPADAPYLQKVADQPETQWLGNWNSDVARDTRNAVAAISGRGSLPVFVVYNIPSRDCGGYSAGGSGSPEAYRSWIRAIAGSIGSSKAVILLEPDALPGMDCLSQNDQNTRLDLLKDAVRVFKAQGNISVYLDAGHALWKSPEEMASRLARAGISEAQGFSLNIANFITTPDSIRYGAAISNLVGNKHFVVDTARNGLGPAPDREWCNPSGRALGSPPSTSTGNNLVEYAAHFWNL